MATFFQTFKAFVKNASGCLRDSRQAEPGHSQSIRAGYARRFLDEVGIEYSGPAKEEVEACGSCIFVANHTSTLDAVIICAFLEGDVRILAKESLFKAPYLGRILRNERHIMVHRGKNASAQNASIRESIHAAIADGASVFFFPEGTRSVTGKLGTFKLGAFYNAIQTGVPIVPVVIRGTFEAMPKKQLCIHGTPCSMKLLPAISLPDESMGDEKTRAQYLADKASEAIRKDLEG